jgi:hypothetical protein
MFIGLNTSRGVMVRQDQTAVILTTMALTFFGTLILLRGQAQAQAQAQAHAQQEQEQEQEQGQQKV